MRCIALDGVVEAFMASRPEQEIAAFKARQEEGRSAANKVNKMFWWLQPSVTPGLPGAGPAGMMGPGGAGMMGPGMPCAGPAGMMGGPKHSTPFQGAMSHPAVAAAASNMMGAGSSPYNNHGNNNGRGLPPSGGSGGAGHHRRASQPGMPPVQSFPRHNGRSNSFSAGGAGPSGMGNQALPPQMAASIAAASFTQPPSMPLGSAGGSADLEAAYLATAQKFGMEGFALPLVYQQQLQQQQLALQQQEHFRGLLNACNDLANADLTASPPNNQSYADPAQLQQLLQGLYFA
ncbi:hypothetical protein HYH03_015204 [Edaphochlamys debaryana]|uniref:Uncharacterized protein n=1 Tax=Edaphochlamys debaryana TaxID=47281 RepID=A0A835XUF6_9CHLO|nr:hypothetical protein HYH03_015204 [Edaphochlamys debaryana]|eukprot:KAG2486109.1 hypothetical protein HYH03_015204 [Edaphochlamys debaryana]